MSETQKKARALLAAATPGPWEVCPDTRPDVRTTCNTGGFLGCGHIATVSRYDANEADAALIAAAPGLLAALCDELDAAERRAEEVEAVPTWTSAACGWCGRVSMDEQSKAFVDGLRAMIKQAGKGTFLPVSEYDTVAINKCVKAVPVLLNALESESSRAEEAEAQAAALLLRVQDISVDFNPGHERENGQALAEMREALEDVAENHPAGRALLDRLHAAEAERDALRNSLTSVTAECARLRSDLDVEREQSAAFVKEIERLRAVEAGAAIMRQVLSEVGRHAEWASTVRDCLRNGAGSEFLAQLLSAERDLAHALQELEFNSKGSAQAVDALHAEVEALKVERDVADRECDRLRAQADADRQELTRLAEKVARLENIGADLLAVAQGCTDYGGGHHDACYDAFQDGIGTVVHVLRERLAGCDDYQMRVLKAIGSEAVIVEGGE